MVLKRDVVLFSLIHFLNISGSIFLLCGFHFNIFSFGTSGPKKEGEGHHGISKGHWQVVLTTSLAGK